jgi:hypothetical protein
MRAIDLLNYMRKLTPEELELLVCVTYTISYPVGEYVPVQTVRPADVFQQNTDGEPRLYTEIPGHKFVLLLEG